MDRQFLKNFVSFSLPSLPFIFPTWELNSRRRPLVSLRAPDTRAGSRACSPWPSTGPPSASHPAFLPHTIEIHMHALRLGGAFVSQREPDSAVHPGIWRISACDRRLTRRLSPSRVPRSSCRPLLFFDRPRSSTCRCTTTSTRRASAVRRTTCARSSTTPSSKPGPATPSRSWTTMSEWTRPVTRTPSDVADSFVRAAARCVPQSAVARDPKRVLLTAVIPPCIANRPEP
jgi:hypothetical protein